jgi:ABC-2 type transport system permease protein
MNAIHIIRREYNEHVRKKSFVIGTILVPVFMLAFLLIPIMLAFFEPGGQLSVAVVDHTGKFGVAFASSFEDTTDSGELKFLFTQEPATGARLSELIEDLDEGRLGIIIEIPADVMESNQVTYITKEHRALQMQEDFVGRLTELMIRERLAQEGLETNQVASLTTRVELRERYISASGEVEEKSFLMDWGLVFGFVMILYMALLTWGITISRSILEEKGSRIIEVLLSSVEPRDLLMGKVVGIGLAGLTQLAIWSTMGLVVTLLGGATSFSILAQVHVPFSVFVYFVVYFVLGFLLYASLFTVIGSICSNEQDAQQLQGLVTMPMVIPILILMVIVQSPNSSLAVVMSLIPFFTPMVMLGRIVVLEPPLWQIGLSIGLMLVSIYFSVAFSARVFRVGILMYGKRPSLPEVIKWYRSAG